MDPKHIVILAFQLSIVCTVLGFGLHATRTDLLYLWQRPKLLLRSLFAVMVVMPVVAVVMDQLFEYKHTVELALVALAMSPLPPLLPSKTDRAGGGHAYMVALLVADEAFGPPAASGTLEAPAPAVQQSSVATSETAPPSSAQPKGNTAGGTTALAVAGPAAAMAIPDDPDSKWDDYGRIGLTLASLGGAAVGMAAARTAPLTGEKLFAARGAGLMLAGVPQKAWADRMIQAGVPEELLPKIHAASTKMLDKEAQKLGRQMTAAKKLVSYFKTGQGDMSWYDDTHKELQGLFGKDADMMAGFLTATSINSTVKSNTTLALKAYKQWKAGEEFNGFLPAVIDELNRVKAGQPLAGRKLDNFRKALTGDPDAVVVDRWMLRAFGYPNKGNSSENAASQRAYDLIENAVKELAAQQGVTPRQMQAAIWFAVKNKAEAGSKRPASPPFQVAIQESINKRHEEALKENRKFDKARAKPQLPF